MFIISPRWEHSHVILGPTTFFPFVNASDLLASLETPLLTSNVVGVSPLVVIFACSYDSGPDLGNLRIV